MYAGSISQRRRAKHEEHREVLARSARWHDQRIRTTFNESGSRVLWCDARASAEAGCCENLRSKQPKKDLHVLVLVIRGERLSVLKRRPCQSVLIGLLFSFFFFLKTCEPRGIGAARRDSPADRLNGLQIRIRVAPLVGVVAPGGGRRPVGGVEEVGHVRPGLPAEPAEDKIFSLRKCIFRCERAFKLFRIS